MAPTVQTARRVPTVRMAPTALTVQRALTVLMAPTVPTAQRAPTVRTAPTVQRALTVLMAPTVPTAQRAPTVRTAPTARRGQTEALTEALTEAPAAQCCRWNYPTVQRARTAPTAPTARRVRTAPTVQTVQTAPTALTAPTVQTARTARCYCCWNCPNSRMVRREADRSCNDLCKHNGLPRFRRMASIFPRKHQDIFDIWKGMLQLVYLHNPVLHQWGSIIHELYSCPFHRRIELAIDLPSHLQRQQSQSLRLTYLSALHFLAKCFQQLQHLQNFPLASKVSSFYSHKNRIRYQRCIQR